MKKKLIFISILLAICLTFSIFTTFTNNAKVYAEENCNLKIKVIGNGESCVKPDIATIKFNITTIGENAQDIEKQNSEKTNSIISALQNLGINKEDINSSSYSLFSKYEWENSKQVYLGYEISNVLEIKTKNLDNITTIISTLTENEVNEILSINLSVEDTKNAYNLALEKALENAKNKAYSLTKNNNLHVCKIYEENLFNGLFNVNRYDAKSLNNENYLNQILQNEVCIKANILVEFCCNCNLNLENNTTENIVNKENGNNEDIINNIPNTDNNIFNENNTQNNINSVQDNTTTQNDAIENNQTLNEQSNNTDNLKNNNENLVKTENVKANGTTKINSKQIYNN